MKKIILTYIGIMLLFITANPNSDITTILTLPLNKPINPYEIIWNKVCNVESKFNPNAYNIKEQATGIVQIRPIRLKDFNNRTGKNYKLIDCYKINISKEIFFYYASMFNPNEHEKIAKDWNKSKTNEYWNKINEL